MKLDTKISFRLGRTDARALEEKAGRLGMSAHQYARFILRRNLESSEQKELHEQLLRLRAELGTLRYEVKQMVQ